MKNIKMTLSAVCAVLCIATIAGAALCVKSENKESLAEESSLQVINIWQIDTFEGGKGSRAEYLRSLGQKFAAENYTYINVTSLNLAAAEENLANGVIPDIISYGSGTCGLESYINENYTTKVWCHGSYCLISLTNDFSDVNPENTIINKGKDNLTAAAALFSGLQQAVYEKPTAAYVKLINGKYKYLLGTQRDVVRMITRGEQFYVKPITVFNDLYQNISVTAQNSSKADLCYKFINYILDNSASLTSVCMLYGGMKLYDNRLADLEGLSYEYTVPAIVSKDWKASMQQAINNCDTDMLKSLLKSL
ncbi:MAG: hypothetical protein LUF82_07710 [Clostridia bacterium]|nr:hypothetical protein [Clostridia bacterium]